MALLMTGRLTAEPPLPDAMGRLDFRKVVTDAKDLVFPAVVFVKCVRQTHEGGKKASEEVSGSGVVIDPNGALLTNWHVVDKAIEIRCLLYDGRAMEAEVIGTDKDLDIALLELKGLGEGEIVPYAQMGDSADLKEGDFVMAMGAPWGLTRSVSIGIVSCTRRFLPKNSHYSLWLQTDAAISPGNSGGPLVNTAGHIVGINTRGVMWGGDMGFAIPAQTIGQLLPRLREHGKVNWSWLGLQLQPLKDFNRNIYFEGTEGVIVSETDPESPARRAGIQARDRILTVNGQALNAITDEDLPDIRRLLGLLPLGQAAAFELKRGDETLTVELTPREKGKVEGDELDCPRWDLTVKTINQFDNPDLHFYRNKGVFIYGIKYPGNAAGASLQRNDIILKIENQKVETLADVEAIHKQTLENVDTKPRIMFTLMRSGLMRQVILDFSRDYERE